MATKTTETKQPKGLLSPKQEKELAAKIEPLFPKDETKRDHAVKRARKWVKFNAGTIHTKPGVKWEAPELTEKDCAKIDALFVVEKPKAQKKPSATRKPVVRKQTAKRTPKDRAEGK